MTKKTKLREEYDDFWDANEDGVIQSLGKFEAEMVYVPYFWEKLLEGCSDFDDGKVVGFYVTKEDKEHFPELKRRRTVKLRERDNGFVDEV